MSFFTKLQNEVLATLFENQIDRSWEDASTVRHGELQANLLPASGVSKGLEMGHHMDPPAATLAVHVRSLSKERRQFLKSKLIVSNQIN